MKPNSSSSVVVEAPGMAEAEASQAVHLLNNVASIRRYDRDEQIFCQDDPSRHVYCLLFGVARECVVRSNGRRHIVDLLLPGDFFGITARANHMYSMQSVAQDTIVASYQRRQVETLAESDPRIAQAMYTEACKTIARLKTQLLVLERTTAVEKVGGYLLQLSKRIRPRRKELAVPVSRYDVADHLGLSVETVSRAITELKVCGQIELTSPRQVTIVDGSDIED